MISIIIGVVFILAGICILGAISLMIAGGLGANVDSDYIFGLVVVTAILLVGASSIYATKEEANRANKPSPSTPCTSQQQ